MICDYCQQEVKGKFEILLDESVSGMIICENCLNDNKKENVQTQIEWLQNHANNVRRSIKNINNRYEETLKKLND